MSDGLDDRPGPEHRIGAIEDPRSDEHTVTARLRHEGGVSRGGDPTSDEVDDHELAQLLGLHDKIVGGGKSLGEGKYFVIVHVAEGADIIHDGANVEHGLNDVFGARLAFGTDHGRTFTDATEGVVQIATTTDKGHLEVVLVDVVLEVDGKTEISSSLQNFVKDFIVKFFNF